LPLNYKMERWRFQKKKDNVGRKRVQRRIRLGKRSEVNLKENRRGSQEWTIQRHRKTEGTIMYGQFRDNGRTQAMQKIQHRKTNEMSYTDPTKNLFLIIHSP
jgi:hypothetical protein